ncbi:nucleotidyltransferase [Lentzea sp. NPDC051838]|uniref:nucleotidyltransferase domain-containing protein n=1 Tax=Lentzea sp. NPDC051838 TaxID=3154849 RepID=UPI00341B7676
MPPPVEETISTLFTGAADILDIPPDLYSVAVERYEDVGNFLVLNGGPEWTVYPQGSFRIGTVIKPPTSNTEYDIDLVCHKDSSKDDMTKEELKTEVGELLQAYDAFKILEGNGDGPALCVEGRRAWTLTYPDLGFHLDVLPAIPDGERPPPRIRLTDTQNHLWQYSNPKGYSVWFQGRSEELRRTLEFKARAAGVDIVPMWTARSTLQRVVQVLKWHCYLYFAKDIGDRPPSVLITTLAAWAYQGERDLFTAAFNAVNGMPEHIQNRHGTWWVPNPAHERENFADKWNEPNERREKFHAWLGSLRNTLLEAAQSSRRDTASVIGSLGVAFGEDLLLKSATRMGLEVKNPMATGARRVAAVTAAASSGATGKFGAVPVVRTRSGRAG